MIFKIVHIEMYICIVNKFLEFSVSSELDWQSSDKGQRLSISGPSEVYFSYRLL